MERIAAKGAIVSYADPYVPDVEFVGWILYSLPLTKEVLGASNCVVMLTAHEGIDYRAPNLQASLVFDAQGVTSGLDQAKVILL